MNLLRRRQPAGAAEAVPQIAREDLEKLRQLLPGLPGENRGSDEDDAMSESSRYFSCPGSSPGSTPRVSKCAPSATASEISAASENNEDIIPDLVTTLRSGDEAAIVAALQDLCGLMDTSFGDAASHLCGLMRSSDAVAMLVELLEPPDTPAPIRQHALVLLGNICSSDVDPAGFGHARRELRNASGFPLLLRYLDDEDYDTRCYALGAVQNTCMEPDYAAVMQERGTIVLLQELMRSGDVNLEPFARGCLINLRETILRAAAERRVSREGGGASPLPPRTASTAGKPIKLPRAIMSG